MVANTLGLSAVLHALDDDLVHLSLHNMTDRLLFYVRPLVIPVGGMLPPEVFQEAHAEVLPAPQRWRWVDLVSLQPGASVSTSPIHLPETTWAAVRYVSLQPLAGIHKPSQPVVSNAVPLRRA